MQVIGVIVLVGIFLVILGNLLEKNAEAGVSIALLTAAVPIFATVGLLAFGPGRVVELDSEETVSNASYDILPSPRSEPETTKVATAVASGSWKEKVYAARDITNITLKRDAMAALVRHALQGTGIQVYVAGESSPEQVHADDYEPAPVLNFDFHLNDKRSIRVGPGGTARSLSKNSGYFFTDNFIPYAIVGPRAINPNSPVFTQLYADHEFYHAQYHIGTELNRPDRELEAWTINFRDYFHKLYNFRSNWAPLIGYYQDATPATRQWAMGQLVGYYDNPPSPPILPANISAVQDAFTRWLLRRLQEPAYKNMQLIQDLEEIFQLGGNLEQAV